MRKAAVTLFVASALFTAASRAAELSVDFLSGTLNGTNWGMLDVGSVTNLLGRPDVIRQPVKTPNGAKLGAVLCYKGKGMRFAFAHPQFNSSQPLLELNVFLLGTTSATDIVDGSTQSFGPFLGSLNNHVNSAWRIEQFLKAFQTSGFRDKSDPEKLAKMRSDYSKLLAMKVPPVSQSNQQVRDLVKEAFQNSIRNLENQSFAEREASPWSVKVYYGPSSKTLTRVVIERQLGSL